MSGKILVLPYFKNIIPVFRIYSCAYKTLHLWHLNHFWVLKKLVFHTNFEQSGQKYLAVCDRDAKKKRQTACSSIHLLQEENWRECCELAECWPHDHLGEKWNPCLLS